MDILDAVLERSTIIALAVVGAIIATLGSYLLRDKSTVDRRTARLVLRIGYGIAWLSVALFIVAGFWSGYR
jgi:hypothetical protein